MLIGWQGRIFVGCGSDHTDRKVEAYSVTVSKQMCDKPIAPALWELEEVIGHWDRMILRSYATIKGERVLYQEGTLDAMLPVADLIARGFGGRELPDGCAMFGGTFAAKGGIRPADRFEFELEDPVLKRTISHGYDVIDAAGAGLSALPLVIARSASDEAIQAGCRGATLDCFAALAMTGDDCPEIGWRRTVGLAKLRP